MIQVQLNNLELMVNWENFVAIVPLAGHDTIQRRLFKIHL